MIRTKEFVAWTRPNGHSVPVDDQINLFIRENDITSENLIDIKYTAYVESVDNSQAITQALLIYKN